MTDEKRTLLNAWLNDLWEQTRYNTIPFGGKKARTKMRVMTDDELALLDLLCEGVQTYATMTAEVQKSPQAIRRHLDKFVAEGWVRTERKEVQGGTLRVWITETGREVARTPCESPMPSWDPDAIRRRKHAG